MIHPARSALRLARPALLPFVLALPALGWAYAHWERARPLTGADALPWVLAAWTALHAGTLWLNAARDRDRGPVLLGQPAPVPAGLVPTGAVALGASVALALRAGAAPAGVTALAVVLSVAYSWPSASAKAHPVGGPLVNVVGYGFLSPCAGASLVGDPPTPRALVVLLLHALGILGCFLVAQAFQGPEDRARGDRTFVARYGAAATITAARACFAAVGLGVAVLGLAGWWPRLVLLALPGLAVADRALRRWAAEGESAGPEGAIAVARRLAWTVVAAVTLAGVHHVGESLAGRPVAGLGTAAGHPADVPRLAPLARRP